MFASQVLLMCIFWVSRGDKFLKAKEMLHSEINLFGAIVRLVIEARIASLSLLYWKVWTIAILLDALISIKNDARSYWRKFIQWLAHMRHELIWFRSRAKKKLSALVVVYPSISSWKKFLAIELVKSPDSKNLFPGVLKAFRKCENI